MKKFLLIAVLGVLAYGAWMFTPGSSQPIAPATIAVSEGEFLAYTTHNGIVESRNVVVITSQFSGNATAVELAAEGSTVQPGDTLVRFDSSKLEQELVKLKSQHALAKAALSSLVNAKLPLEVSSLEASLVETMASLQTEKEYLGDSLKLHKNGMISDQEIKQQERKVKNWLAKQAKLEMELELTVNHLHPSAIQQAEAKLLSAKNSLRLTQEQLLATSITAPSSGVVVYKPLNISGDHRTIRIGDNIYPNQTLMVLPDMDNLLVHCEIPESEISLLQTGREALLRPLAFPDMELSGTVQSVGSVAQSLPGKPAWQKYFHVTIGISKPDPRIRPGMSITAHVISSYNELAMLVPRRTVKWQGDVATAIRVDGESYSSIELSLGKANNQYYELLKGAEPGDLLLVQ